MCNGLGTQHFHPGNATAVKEEMFVGCLTLRRELLLGLLDFYRLPYARVSG
jgi:hypothetical protein